MKVETRTSPLTTEPEVAPTVRTRRSRHVSAALLGMVIVAAGALGVLGNDGGSDGSPKPTPATVSAEPAGTPVIPFLVVPPATDEGVSSVDG